MVTFFHFSSRTFLFFSICLQFVIRVSTSENPLPCSTYVTSEDCLSSLCIWYGSSCQDQVDFLSLNRSLMSQHEPCLQPEETIGTCQRSQSEVIGIPESIKQLLLIVAGLVWTFIVIIVVLYISKTNQRGVKETPERLYHKVTLYQSINPQETTTTNYDDAEVANELFQDNPVKSDDTNKIMNTHDSYKMKSFGWIIKAILMGLAISAVIAYFPKPPKVSVCATQIEWIAYWERIFLHHKNNNNSTEQEDSQNDLFPDTSVLLSVYNPNLYDIEIDSAQIKLRYEDMRLGSICDDKFLLQAQSITDDLILTHFQPENFQVTFDILSNLFQKRQLQFTLDITLRVTLFHMSHTINLHHVDFNLTKDELYSPHNHPNKELCLCK